LNNLEQLIKYGFARINLTPNLLSNIQNFYFDICRYLLIIIKDSAVEIDKVLVTAFSCAINRNELIEKEDNLQKILIIINEKDRSLLGLLYDIGTQPIKLKSGNNLFYDPQVETLINSFF
jgi:hypothetical protein